MSGLPRFPWRRSGFWLGLWLLALAPVPPVGAQTPQKPPTAAPAPQKPAAAAKAPQKPAAATTAPANQPQTPAVPPLSLDIAPSDIVLDMATPASGRALVIAHNPRAVPFADPKLDFIATAGVDATITRPPPPPYTGDLVWEIAVTAGEKAPSGAKLVARLSYKLVDDPRPPIVITASAGVSSPAPTASDTLKATLLPPDSIVESGQAFDLVLHIDNPTRLTVSVKEFAVRAPAGVSFAQGAAAPAGAQTIGPGGGIEIPLHLIANAAIPDSYTLVIGYKSALLAQSPAWQAGAAQSKIAIQVRGISDALKYIGVPSLLLLPGILFLTIISWAWPRFTGRPGIDPKQPIWLVAAVVLSYGAKLLYPYATCLLLGHARDIDAYQMRDVVLLWGGSILAGLLLALLAALWLGMVDLWKEFQERHDPKPGDKPADILKKLLHFDHGFMLDAVREDQTQPNANPGILLALPFARPGANMVWLVRRATLTPLDRPGTAGRLATIRNLLEGANDLANTRLLLTAVNAGLRAGEIEQHWVGAPETGPIQAEAAKYPDAVGQQSLFAPPP